MTAAKTGQLDQHFGDFLRKRVRFLQRFVGVGIGRERYREGASLLDRIEVGKRLRRLMQKIVRRPQFLARIRSESALDGGVLEGGNEEHRGANREEPDRQEWGGAPTLAR